MICIGELSNCVVFCGQIVFTPYMLICADRLVSRQLQIHQCFVSIRDHLCGQCGQAHMRVLLVYTLTHTLLN